MKGSSITSLFGGSRGVKGGAAPVRRFAPKATVSAPAAQAAPPPVPPGSDKPKAKAKPKAAVHEPPRPPSHEEVGEMLNTLASGASEYLDNHPKPDNSKSRSTPSAVRPVPKPKAAPKGTRIGSGSAVQPMVTFGENTVHEAPVAAPDADAAPQQSIDVRSTKSKAVSTRSSSNHNNQPDPKQMGSPTADIDIEFKGLKKRSAQSATAPMTRSKRSKTGSKAPEAHVLPEAYAAGTSYTVHTVYLKKTESGVGLKLKEVDGKAVVKKVADHIASSGVRRNDVIMAANDLDARTSSFEAIVEKFRWTPRVGDWCGLQSSAAASGQPVSIPNPMRKRSGSVDSASGAQSKAATHKYLQLTTEEQDILASYPVKLSRVEDVVCVMVARPIARGKKEASGVYI